MDRQTCVIWMMRRIDEHLTDSKMQSTLVGLYGDEAAVLHPEIFGGAS